MRCLQKLADSSLFGFLTGILLLAGCAGDPGVENDATGAYSPKLIFPPNLYGVNSTAKSLVGINCEEAGLSTLEFTFTRDDISYGPYSFDCADHGALISDVPVGLDVRVDVHVYNLKNVLMLNGAEVIDITEGQVNDGGEISLAYAPPYLAVYQEDEPDYVNEFGMGFNLVPAGEFVMGSPEDEEGRAYWEHLPHPVVLTRAFYMQTTEVTQRQWESVMETESPAFFKDCGPNCPVETVSWEDAVELIEILNARDDGPCTYRLPTEAEWEYTARAGSQTAFANGPITHPLHGYDPVLNSMGWYVSNSDVGYEGCYDLRDGGGDACSGTHPVAGKEPNGWGFYDMHGSLWEWCLDWFEEGQELEFDMTDPLRDPQGPDDGYYRVIRGGSWVNIPRQCRSAHREYITPITREIWYGIRLVCSMGDQ